jgi:hypothetical protein
MKKSLLFAIFLVLSLIPNLTTAQAPFVQCGNPGQSPCTIQDVFNTIGRIYSFLVLYIATPLSILGLMIGSIMLMASAGNPSMAQNGKRTLMFSIIGLILTLGSYLIIKTILIGLGYRYNF